MSSEEEFDREAWGKRLMATKTFEEMNKVLLEYPLTEEEIQRAGSMKPEDLEYFFTVPRRSRRL